MSTTILPIFEILYKTYEFGNVKTLWGVRLLSRISQGDKRGNNAAFVESDNAGDLALIEYSHNYRTQAVIVRGKAEGLGGDSRVEHLPFVTLAGGEAAVGIVAANSPDGCQNDKGCGISDNTAITPSAAILSITARSCTTT